MGGAGRDKLKGGNGKDVLRGGFGFVDPTSLVVMDSTPQTSGKERFFAAAVDENPWLAQFLLNGAEDDDTFDPNDDIAVKIDDEESSDNSGDASDESTSNSGKGKKK